MLCGKPALFSFVIDEDHNLLASGCYEPSVNSQMVVQCSMCKKGEWPESPGCTVEWRKWPSAPGTRSPSRGPPEARLGCCNGAHGSRQREATRAKLPLTSSITLAERKRGSDGAAHQATSHPRGSRRRAVWMRSRAALELPAASTILPLCYRE